MHGICLQQHLILFVWWFSCAGWGARLFWFCRLGPWQGIQSFSFIQKYNIKGMHLWLGKFLKPFAWWCFASASCEQQRRRGCYRILEAKVKGEFHLYVVLHCIALWWKQAKWIECICVQRTPHQQLPPRKPTCATSWTSILSLCDDACRGGEEHACIIRREVD